MSESLERTDFKQDELAAKWYLQKVIVKSILNTPALLKQFPHLLNVLKFINVAEIQDLHGNSLLEKISRDIVNEETFAAFMKNPLRTLSSHASHNRLYCDDSTVGGFGKDALEFCFKLLRSHLLGKQIRVIEVGCGTGGFLQRCDKISGINEMISQYFATDFFPMKLDAGLIDRFNIKMSRWNINKEFDTKSSGLFDVVVACNSIHTSENILLSLIQMSKVVENHGFLLLEECLCDLPIYMWGLDKYIWNTAKDKRSYGLWNDKKRWEEIFSDCSCPWEPITWILNDRQMLLVAKKKNANNV